MMMTIDVRKLNVQKKYAGELTFEFEGDESLIGIPFVSFSSPVKAELHYEILEDDSVEVTGKLTFSLKGACSRCLTDTERSYLGEVDAYFLPHGGEPDDYVYTSGVINLSDCLRDALMLSMPLRLECERECVALEWHEQ